MEGEIIRRAAARINPRTRYVILATYRGTSLASFSSQRFVDNFYCWLHVDEFGAIDKKVFSVG